MGPTGFSATMRCWIPLSIVWLVPSLASDFLNKLIPSVDFDHEECIGDACFLKNQVLQINRNSTKGKKKNKKGKKNNKKGNKKGKNDRKYVNKPNKESSPENTAKITAKLAKLGFTKLPTKSTMDELNCMWEELED